MFLDLSGSDGASVWKTFDDGLYLKSWINSDVVEEFPDRPPS